MRASLISFLLLLFPVGAVAENISVYVCAHPDDCVLFMNPQQYDDLASSNSKVVTIYLTSGDAGQAFSKTDKSYPYVRELAALESTDWAADTTGTTTRATRHADTVHLHNHPIDRVHYAHNVSYFLRLPDGAYYGEGFARTHYQSMKKLKQGDIPALAPIDGRKPYHRWEELTQVLAAIVARETQGATPTLHVQEPDTRLNKDDHSDHTLGAEAMLDALAQQANCIPVYKHIDYAIAGMTPNLDATALTKKAGSFAVLTATQRRYFRPHHWDSEHRPFLGQNYYATALLPQDCTEAVRVK